ncbi:MAG: hypothetical protein IPP71_04080 [Bacteroidetes bacterium]|nr:hypothetical protein [Bacteroidota bacterium]
MSKEIKKCPFHSLAAIQEMDALDPEARANPIPITTGYETILIELFINCPMKITIMLCTGMRM